MQWRLGLMFLCTGTAPGGESVLELLVDLAVCDVGGKLLAAELRQQTVKKCNDFVLLLAQGGALASDMCREGVSASIMVAASLVPISAAVSISGCEVQALTADRAA